MAFHHHPQRLNQLSPASNFAQEFADEKLANLETKCNNYG